MQVLALAAPACARCSFANPYQKKPVTISCKTETSKGLFVGEFISNGISPDVTVM
jgi:hypothetical protein